MTHTDIDTGVTGAKRVSFRKTNPREILLSLIKKHQGLYDQQDDDGLRSLFEQEVIGSPAIYAIIEYYFTNHLRSIRGPAPRGRTSADERQKAMEAAKKRVEAVVTARVQIVLLDLILPHGKALRDSTGAECAKLGPQIGAWLTRISTEVKPNQIVGKALTEERVRAIYTDMVAKEQRKDAA